MKKLMKILLGVVVVLVVVLLVGVLTLPFTIGPVVRTAAVLGGPVALGVPVSVGDVKLRPLLGVLTISQVKVGNPEGYSKNKAFAVEKVEIGLKTSSLFSDTIEITKIQIDAPAISYESKDGKSNFDTMLANAKKNAEEQKAKKPNERRSTRKVIIDEFSLNSGKVSVTSGLTLGKAMMIPLPSVTVRDIGKASGGASFADALTQVINGILNGLTQAITGAAGAAADMLKGLEGVATKGVTDAAKGAADAAKGATDSLKGAASGATDAASDSVKAVEAAAKGAADAAKDAANSLKKLNPFKK